MHSDHAHVHDVSVDFTIFFYYLDTTEFGTKKQHSMRHPTPTQHDMNIAIVANDIISPTLACTRR